MTEEKKQKRPRKYEFWISKIDCTKSASQLSKELHVTSSTVYHAARTYNLPLPRASDCVKDYKGISLEQFKEELKTYTLGDVAKMHGISSDNLRSWLINRGVTEFSVNKIRKAKPQQITKPMKRTGEAMDMIKYLTTHFTDASIGRVFGYSKERIRQIRYSLEDNE